jgi:hypothetical protein
MYLIQRYIQVSEYKLVCTQYILVCTSTYSYVPPYAEDVPKYIQVCTWCVPVHTWMYSTEACLTGFRGAHRDANTRVPDIQQLHADDDHGNQDPCLENDELF